MRGKEIVNILPKKRVIFGSEEDGKTLHIENISESRGKYTPKSIERSDIFNNNNKVSEIIKNIKTELRENILVGWKDNQDMKEIKDIKNKLNYHIPKKNKEMGCDIKELMSARGPIWEIYSNYKEGLAIGRQIELQLKQVGRIIIYIGKQTEL